jgi:hypothetical protein
MNTTVSFRVLRQDIFRPSELTANFLTNSFKKRINQFHNFHNSITIDSTNKFKRRCKHRSISPLQGFKDQCIWAPLSDSFRCFGPIPTAMMPTFWSRATGHGWKIEQPPTLAWILQGTNTECQWGTPSHEQFQTHVTVLQLSNTDGPCYTLNILYLLLFKTFGYGCWIRIMKQWPNLRNYITIILERLIISRPGGSFIIRP